VMVESMAAGTPVIAMKLGSTVEVIADGKTGYLCDNVDQCVDAVSQIEKVERLACRQHVYNYFSVQRMTDGYEAVYQQLLAEKFARNGHSRKPVIVGI